MIFINWRQYLIQETREAIEDYLPCYDIPPLRLAAIKDDLGMISDHILAITKPDVNHDSNAVTDLVPMILISY